MHEGMVTAMELVSCEMSVGVLRKQLGMEGCSTSSSSTSDQPLIHNFPQS